MSTCVNILRLQLCSPNPARTMIFDTALLVPSRSFHVELVDSLARPLCFDSRHVLSSISKQYCLQFTLRCQDFYPNPSRHSLRCLRILSTSASSCHHCSHPRSDILPCIPDSQNNGSTIMVREGGRSPCRCTTTSQSPVL